ncbi:D-2-hydroxyacid dehydrogenase [Opitutaceae bacterium TAV3]|nr:D-2-hydroxyacid dehydrogenase [Opitutaceae bacterium TAV3]
MNILIFRDISATDLTALSAEFPQCNFRQTMDLSLLEKDPSWPAVIFGNVPSALLPRCSNLRWLQIVSSGFDEYLPPPASHVIMTTARDIRAPIIAEQVVMTFLAFARQLPHFLHCQREKKWDRRPSIPQIIQKQTVGILGYGSVGKEVARLLKPFGVRLIATKRSVPPPPPPELDALLPLSQLDELLATSDHLVIALPLTDQTRRILDKNRIAMLKRGAVVHNIARGGLLDEDALIERLRDGSLGGAALDVFEREPLPADSPFWELPNVLVTPHLAGHHAEVGALLFQQFKLNLARFLDGKALECVADFSRGY